MCSMSVNVDHSKTTLPQRRKPRETENKTKPATQYGGVGVEGLWGAAGVSPETKIEIGAGALRCKAPTLDLFGRKAE